MAHYEFIACYGDRVSISKSDNGQMIGRDVLLSVARAAPDLVAALNKIRAEDSCSPVIAFICDQAIAQAQ